MVNNNICKVVVKPSKRDDKNPYRFVSRYCKKKNFGFYDEEEVKKLFLQYLEECQSCIRKARGKRDIEEIVKEVTNRYNRLIDFELIDMNGKDLYLLKYEFYRFSYVVRTNFYN